MPKYFLRFMTCLFLILSLTGIIAFCYRYNMCSEEITANITYQQNGTSFDTFGEYPKYTVTYSYIYNGKFFKVSVPNYEVFKTIKTKDIIRICPDNPEKIICPKEIFDCILCSFIFIVSLVIAILDIIFFIKKR